MKVKSYNEIRNTYECQIVTKNLQKIMCKK